MSRISEIHSLIDARAARLKDLANASEHFDSDVTQIVGRDDDGGILFVAAFALGDEAVALDAFLSRDDGEGA